MNRIAWLLTFLVAALLSSPPAMAQSIDDLELRKRRAQQNQARLRLPGYLGDLRRPQRGSPGGEHPALCRTAAQDRRPDAAAAEHGLLLELAPPPGEPLGPHRHLPAVLPPGHLQGGLTGMHFSGYGRYYFPTSKASRNDLLRPGPAGGPRLTALRPAPFGPGAQRPEVLPRAHHMGHRRGARTGSTAPAGKTSSRTTLPSASVRPSPPPSRRSRVST